MRITPSNIKSLESNQVFVFGSNEAGRHGKGAAKTAMKWGAVYGRPVGLQGQTYAIPTKDKLLKTLTIDEIRVYVNRFIGFAKFHNDLIFLVTEIGCGLAGLKPSLVKTLFTKARDMENIYLPISFLK